MTISSTTPTQSVITTQRGPASWPRGTPSLAARAWPVSERRGKAGRRPVVSSHWAWQWTLSPDTAYTCTPHCRPAPPSYLAVLGGEGGLGGGEAGQQELGLLGPVPGVEHQQLEPARWRSR